MVARSLVSSVVTALARRSTGGARGAGRVRWRSGGSEGLLAAASLPPTPTAAEVPEAVQRLVAAVAGDPGPLAEPAVGRWLSSAGRACGELDAQQLKGLLAAFGKLQHMPPALWGSGLEDEVPRMLEELPDMGVVHAALLMSALELRSNQPLLQELAEQLEARSSSPEMSTTALMASAHALSQLGPWPVPPPGADVAAEITKRMEDGSVSLTEATTSALALATLGTDCRQFWIIAHGLLRQRVEEMTPKHFTDALLALATTQLCPVMLLEELRGHLHVALSDGMEPDEALTCAWALSCLRIFPDEVFPILVRRASGAAAFGEMESNQLHQVALSLELDPEAASARAGISEVEWTKIRRPGSSLLGEASSADRASSEELAELLDGQGVSCELGEQVDGFYFVDVAVRSSGAPPVAIVFDVVSDPDSKTARDPFLQLKCLHLTSLGWTVKRLSSLTWRIMDLESRKGFACDLAKFGCE